MTPREKYEAGRAALASGHDQEAIELLVDSARQQPHHKTYELVGEALLRNRNAPEAVLYLAAASSLNRGVRAISLLASALFEAGLTEDAFAAAEEALRRDPKNKLATEILKKK